jgi:hypothetical protein
MRGASEAGKDEGSESREAAPSRKGVAMTALPYPPPDESNPPTPVPVPEPYPPPDEGDPPPRPPAEPDPPP